MSLRRLSMILAVCGGAAACTPLSERGTLAELQRVEPDIEEVFVDDSLGRAARSYRQFLRETPQSDRTPEAMRRLADLQIEQAYGVIGSGDVEDMTAPTVDSAPRRISAGASPQVQSDPTESYQDFEERASRRQLLLSDVPVYDAVLPGVEEGAMLAGPREAIETYQVILETYPDYERNDQVLYQMSRAYEEIGLPDDAMTVMNRLVSRYPYSKYADEVHFRRGEYFFVRKKYLDAEAAYGALIAIGDSSSYYELARYKLGWAFYKQELYEEALQHYIAMLDHRLIMGYDFDQPAESDDDHRVADAFRAISLSFSNLGAPEVIDDYFATYGRRHYADKIYGNLGEFYFGKRRFDDAASVYKSFVRLNPLHQVSPKFGMRVIEIYGAAGFPQLVVESKKQFATDYAIDAEYWQHFDLDAASEIVGFLKANLTDLANHYHALYQDDSLADDRSANFIEAQHWYREFLASFEDAPESPQINYQLADLLMEDKDYAGAAQEYARTAYGYGVHERAPAAGYAAIYAWRQELEAASGPRQEDVRRTAVASSLRFAETFPMHEQTPAVLSAAADDLYTMRDFGEAIVVGHLLTDRYPAADPALLRSAWAVIAHSSMDVSDYPSAEQAYLNVLDLVPLDDESRPAVIDGLASSIYKQGEEAALIEDDRAAADHFLRVKTLAPTSKIRAVAEYDAAAALMKLEDWTLASGVLEEFRTEHPEHELQDAATKQLASIYRSDGQIERSAAEHERIASEADDSELRRDALLTAAELYDEVGALQPATRVYEQYVSEYPRPVDIALETRARLAEIYKAGSDIELYHTQLNAIITGDREAGEDRTDRSRYLAAEAALVLAMLDYQRFAELRLMQPFEQSLAEKQRRMDIAMEAFENLVPYEVAGVTAAATYYIAEIYFEFSDALLTSERPANLSAAEKGDYEMVIEEEAFPFEERAIEIHESNIELLASGIFNSWIQKSLVKLAVMMPGRYAKSETSHGFIRSMSHFSYRIPGAPTVVTEAQELPDHASSESESPLDAPIADAQASGDSES